jgi:NADP-dependent 3-hydroxy acid dehydrogenase YdfG
LLTGALPTVDILVNNLGIFEPKPFAEIADEDWLRFFEVNVLSRARLSRFSLPQMLQRNWGRIVFLSSESGVNIPVEMVHYGVTRTAQIALARGLAETTAGTAVTVNSVLPGPTRSEGVEQFLEDLAKGQGTDAARVEAEFFRTARPTSLLKRFSTPEEVAALVVYVCSPRVGVRWQCGRVRPTWTNVSPGLSPSSSRAVPFLRPDRLGKEEERSETFRRNPVGSQSHPVEPGKHQEASLASVGAIRRTKRRQRGRRPYQEPRTRASRSESTV